MKNTQRIGFLASIALSLLFASCDNKELPDNEHSGEMIPVQVRLLGMAESGSEDLTRAASQKEPQLISNPIGDGMLLDMSIEQDEPSLRGLVDLAPNAYFRVIAIESSTKKVYTYGDFTHGSGTNSLPTFYVHVGSTYDFICISYNDQTLPSHTYTKGSALPTFSGITNAKELLWWSKTGVKVDTKADVDLQIELKQTMARVKVIVDCDYNSWKITSVTASSVSVGAIASGTLNWETGVITGTASTQAFTSFTSTANSPTQSSTSITIIPTTSNATIRLAASAVVRSSGAPVPTATTTATLASTLSPGFNYTLKIRIRIPIFASSNIYWDGDDSSGKLTFSLAEATGTNRHEGYQGVFFKWGSLVGVSPAETDQGNYRGCFDDGNYIPIYIPNGSTKTWTRAIASTAGYTTWKNNIANTARPSTDIPYIDSSYRIQSYPNSRADTYLIDAARNDPTTMWANLMGDICQYLGMMDTKLKGYRSPIQIEFSSYHGTAITFPVETWNTSGPVAGGWIKGDGDYSTHTPKAGNPYGTVDFINDKGFGYAYNQTLDMSFPASGYRGDGSAAQPKTGGQLGEIGQGGYYQSGSVYMGTGTVYDQEFRFFESDVQFTNGAAATFGRPVRCVKKIDPTGSY